MTIALLPLYAASILHTLYMHDVSHLLTSFAFLYAKKGK